MDKRLIVVGTLILFSSLFFYPGFYREPAPGQTAPVLSERVLQALERGERALNCVVWVKHHSTTLEKKIELLRAMENIATVGGTVQNLYPNLCAITASVPAENVYSLLEMPGVAFVDLNAEVEALGTVYLSIDSIVSILGVEELPGDGKGVDVFVLDTGAPVDIPVDTAVSMVGGSPYDGNGHGSAVVGIIKSIAPGARIHCIKVLRDDGRGDISAVLAGVDYVLDHKTEKTLVNASLGLPESPVCSLKEAFSVLVVSGAEAVVAAGNDPFTPMSPGTCPQVITVGAISGDNLLTSYSYRKFDVVSYGDQVGTAGIFKGKDIRGTSFATPVVTGLAARYLSSIKGGTAQVCLEETVKKATVLTPEGYPMPTAYRMAETPPEPEQKTIVPMFFLPVLLCGLSLLISGFLSPKKAF